MLFNKLDAEKDPLEKIKENDEFSKAYARGEWKYQYSKFRMKNNIKKSFIKTLTKETQLSHEESKTLVDEIEDIELAMKIYEKRGITALLDYHRNQIRLDFLGIEYHKIQY